MRSLTATLFTGLLLAVPLSADADENESPFQYDKKSPFTAGDQAGKTVAKPKPQPKAKSNATKPKFKTDEGPTFNYDDPKPKPRIEPIVKPEPKPAKTTAEPVKRVSRLGDRYSAAKALAARLLHERELRNARNRRARIQTRKWAGKSALRPVYTGEISPVYSMTWPYEWSATENYRMYWRSR